MTTTIMKVALIGATGKSGGWVLEECLERNYDVRALVRTPSKLEAFQDRVTVVEGDATDSAALQRLIYGDDSGNNSNSTKPLVDVVISTIGSPNKETLVVEKTALALVKALQDKQQQNIPRILWMTSTGINEATQQAMMYPLIGKSPSKWFFGYGLFGWLQFKILIPYVISQNVWDDMARSETVLRENSPDITEKTVLVRPCNMHPVSEAPAFSEQWRSEGGAKDDDDDNNNNLEYKLVSATDPPPGIWINRRVLAKAIVDLVEDTSRDGTAVSVF